MMSGFWRGVWRGRRIRMTPGIPDEIVRFGQPRRSSDDVAECCVGCDIWVGSLASDKALEHARTTGHIVDIWSPV